MQQESGKIEREREKGGWVEVEKRKRERVQGEECREIFSLICDGL